MAASGGHHFEINIKTKNYKTQFISQKHVYTYVIFVYYVQTQFMATERLFYENIIIISSEAVRGIKLKFSSSIHNISLYKTDGFLLQLPMYFLCYGNLNFPLAYNGKIEN